MNGFIFESDKRFKVMKQELKNKGFTIYDSLEKPESLSFLVLGLKGIDHRYFMMSKDHQLKLEPSFFKRLKKGTRIYTGVYNALLDELCKQNELVYHVILHEDALMDLNALLTSEALISIMISTLHEPLFSLKILITGFGKCGKALAKRLDALGADLTIALRNPTQMIEAKKKGFKVIDMKELDVFKGDVVINTVPSIIFDDELLLKFSHAVFFDIASFPYGLDHSKAKAYQIETYLLPGLPGKYAYQYAGRMFSNYIISSEESYV